MSIWQVTTRNPAATAANPQMQSMQKFMPLIFLVLYIALPAGVGVYFIVSSLFRVAQQEWMYKHDPTIVAAIQELTKRKQTDAADRQRGGGCGASGPGTEPGPARRQKGFLARMREAAESGRYAANVRRTTSKPAPKTRLPAGGWTEASHEWLEASS